MTDQKLSWEVFLWESLIIQGREDFVLMRGKEFLEVPLIYSVYSKT